MKYLILFLTIFTSNVMSQTVNGFPLKEIELEYIRIVGTLTFKGKVSVDIDFGQQQKYFTKKDTQIIDVDGKKKKFNSMIDAINYMHQFGYEMVQAYAITVDKLLGKQTVYHYLMQKIK